MIQVLLCVYSRSKLALKVAAYSLNEIQNFDEKSCIKSECGDDTQNSELN